MSDRSELQTISISDVDQTITAAGTATVRADVVADHALTAFIDVGLWTDGIHTFHLEDSPDDSAWTDVAAAYQVGAAVVNSLTTDNMLYALGYVGPQRYVRVAWDVSGATTGLASVNIGYVMDEPADV